MCSRCFRSFTGINPAVPQRDLFANQFRISEPSFHSCGEPVGVSSYSQDMEIWEMLSGQGMHVQVRQTGELWRQLAYARRNLRCLLKRLLDNLLLGFLTLLDQSLGVFYFAFDIVFDGLEAYKAKDIIHPHNLSLASEVTSNASSSKRKNVTRFGDEHIPTIGTDNEKSLLLRSTVVDNLKPRRAGIISQKQNVRKEHEQQMKQLKFSDMRELSSEKPPCTCWGWEVEECLDEQIFMHSNENFDDNVDSENTGKDIRIRWSECQCQDCQRLWMPMSKARSSLHIQTWNLTLNKACEIHLSDDCLCQTSLNCTISGNPVMDANQNSETVAETLKGDGYSRWLPASISSAEKTGIIFLHGIFSSSDFWFDGNIVPRLDDSIKSRHLILVPDLLGCGRSPRPSDSVYTLNDQLEALESSLLNKYALHSFHIVAHSMGTVPAVALAARFPNRLRSLTLIAPVYAGYTEGNQGDKDILTDCDSILSFQDPWSAKALRSLTASRHYNINRFLGHFLFSRHQLLVPIFQRLLNNRWPASFVRDYLAVTHDAAWHIVHNTMIGGSHAIAPALRKLRDRGQRVFVVHGTNDTSCPFQQSVTMTQHFDNVVLAPVPGKGHVDVVLGRDDKVVEILEREIRLGDHLF